MFFLRLDTKHCEGGNDESLSSAGALLVPHFVLSTRHKTSEEEAGQLGQKQKECRVSVLRKWILGKKL